MSAAGAFIARPAAYTITPPSYPTFPILPTLPLKEWMSITSYLDAHDTKQMMADVESIVKRNPRAFPSCTGAVGFLLARALRND